jgi:hypothetical protein
MKWARVGVGAPGATLVGILGHEKREVICFVSFGAKDVERTSLQSEHSSLMSLHAHSKDLIRVLVDAMKGQRQWQMP